MLELQSQVDKFLQLSTKELKDQRQRVIDDYDCLNTSAQFPSILVKTMKDLQGIREIYEDGIMTIHKLIKIEENWKLGFGLEMIFKGLKKHAALQDHIFTVYQSLEVNTGITKAPKKEVEEEKDTGEDPLEDMKTDDADLDDDHNYEYEFKDSDLEVICKEEEKEENEDHDDDDEYTKILSRSDFKTDLENSDDNEEINKNDPDYNGVFKQERKPKKEKSVGVSLNIKHTASCRLCTPPVSFSDNHARSEHIRAIHRRTKFECDLCQIRFKTNKGLKLHQMKHVEGEEPTSKCVVCDETFVSGTILKKHFKEFHAKEKGKPFQCNECEKSFRENSTLVVHKRKHSGERPFKCDQCFSEWISAKALRGHIRWIHNKEEQVHKTFDCKRCGKILETKSKLQYHIKKRHNVGNVKKFVCDQCGLKTESNSYLKIHMKVVHKGERPFSCEECEKTFTRKTTYEQHKLLHTGQKTFQCEVCEKSFAMSRYLINHLRTHTGEKPYKCAYCDKQFAQSSDRLKHQKNVHKNAHPIVKVMV